ncbi:MAG TPA: ComEC/Rec2 family competence protein [Burkholderiaceae bacterium]|nr:ComEC/Rec2 family competence protein [Burkholderiaceae bacterium]
MRTAILGFAAGAAWLQMQAALPEWPVIASGLLLALAGCCLRRGWLRAALVLAAGLLLGFGWAAMQARAALADRLDIADEGRDITLVGTVANLPFQFGDGVRFNFAVERVLGADLHVPANLSLAWYANRRGAGAGAAAAGATLQPAAALASFADGAAFGDVQPGERWQLAVRLQRPHGNANPYGFDYEVWLLEQGLRATGYVRPSAANRRLDSLVPSFGHVVEHCRAVLRDRIQRALPGKEYAGVIVALVVGDQRGIPLVNYKQVLP